jgi:hypothetical protein
MHQPFIKERIMGLDFSYEGEGEWTPNKPRWAYSGFMRFRCRLLAHYGIILDPKDALYNYSRIIEEGLNPETPLYPLLYHSDCDGELTPDECAKVAPALRRAVENWADDDYDKQRALGLCEFMENCVKLNTPLIFC